MIRDVIAVYSSGDGQYKWIALCLGTGHSPLYPGIESREVVTIGVPGAYSPSPANLVRLSPVQKLNTRILRSSAFTIRPMCAVKH
jgi:hypothetical protein